MFFRVGGGTTREGEDSEKNNLFMFITRLKKPTLLKEFELIPAKNSTPKLFINVKIGPELRIL